jgi:hypothetical protein
MPTEVFTLDATEIVTKDWVFDSTIAGRVLAPDGITPVGGVSVRFFPGGGPIGGPGGEVAATEPDGTFQTPFLPEANYSLRLVPPAGSGLAQTTIEDVVVPANTDHDAGDLVLIGEADGVPDAVEDGAPNGGDGNGDGILDSVQAHVTSLPNAVDGQYVTLEAAVGTTLANVEAIDPATLTPEPPAGAQLPVGVLGFEVLVANPGDAADVVLHLPAGLSVDEYLKLHDGTWTAFPGASFDGDTVTLSLVDGGAGDDDDTADGVIIEPGGPATLAEQQTATLEVSADTYLRSGNDNTNEGAATFLQVRSSGNNRALVAVDATALDELIGGGEIISAELELDVVENGGNWGSEGRTVDIHRLTSAWAEGNGFVADHQPTDRGSGEGATWNCAIDAEIANQRPDCDGPTEWEMGKPNQPELHPWEPDPTDTLLITSDLSGEVGFDVTDDVLAFTSGSEAHHGWIIKKTVEGANGKVRFSSRQGTSAPRLVITYIPS